jgi:Fe-S cluster assembly protein SufD
MGTIRFAAAAVTILLVMPSSADGATEMASTPQFSVASTTFSEPFELTLSAPAGSEIRYTVIDHAEPHCTSRELYKGILDDSARAVFNGRVVVRADAQKTDSQQTNKNLLLSDDALVNTNPQLEINADDVKCAHGATIGQLDANALFYLRSRGIDEQTARSLLTQGFMSDVTDRIQIDAVRSAIEKILVASLPRG